MNVVLFVTTVLMLLTIVTYVKVDAFRIHTIVQVQFEEYMASRERSYFSEAAARFYQKTVINPKDDNRAENKNGNDEEDNKKANTSLSVAALFPSATTAGSDISQTKQQLADLLAYTYKDYPYISEALEKNPNLFEDIANAVAEAAREAQDLDILTLDIADPEAQKIYYMMLKGSDKSTPLNELIAVDDASKLPIRLALAKDPILFLIFRDQATIMEVKTARKALYLRRRKDEVFTEQEATQEFKSQFSDRVFPPFTPENLDFKVTKTRPPL